LQGVDHYPWDPFYLVSKPAFDTNIGLQNGQEHTALLRLLIPLTLSSLRFAGVDYYPWGPFYLVRKPTLDAKMGIWDML